jgi:hypothetical protein
VSTAHRVIGPCPRCTELRQFLLVSLEAGSARDLLPPTELSEIICCPACRGLGWQVLPAGKKVSSRPAKLLEMLDKVTEHKADVDPEEPVH